MANTPNNLNELFGLPLLTTGDGHSSSVVNNYKNLNDSVTAVDGTYDSNANKIWNDATSAELQMKLGDTLGNYAITTDDKGNKFQMGVDAEGNSKLVPYAGKTRRFYEYGTKDPNSNAVKFGLSTGQYSSSDARYSDLLGHPSGELGVDVRRKILDVELPYDKATELEAVLHGNKTAQQARLVQLGDAKKRKLYGSGASEYYSSVEGVLGDVSGVDLSGVSVPKFVNDEDTKRATRPKVSGNVHDIVNLLLPDGTSATSAYKLPEETIDRFGTVAKGDIGNAIVGGLGTVVKEGVLRPLDFIGDVTGTFSLGDVDKRFDKFIGYDTTNTRKVQAKVSGLTDIVLDGNAPTADRLAAGMQATYETVKDPDQLTTSLGTLAAWMLPGTWLKLLGVGEKAVVASKAIDRAMDAGTMTRTAGTVEKMKLLGTESGLKKLGAEQSGMVSAAFGNVNEQYTEFVKNNNGKELVGADKLEWFATRLPVQLVNQNLDALTDISILKSPGLIRSATQAIDDLGNKQFAKLALGVGEVIGSTVFKEMPKEATQEYTQQMMEVFNKKFGSEKFKDLDTFEKFVTDKENLKESVQAALSGAGGAVQFKALDTGFKAPKVVADAVQSGISRVQQAQTQGETEQIPVPSSPTTLSEKYGSPETAKSTVDSTMAEFNKAIEDNKIGTANKLLTKLYEDIKIDTEGHIDREVFTAARDLVVQKNDNIAARIADNNGEIDAETMQLLGSDKDSIGMLFQKTSTPELEHMVSKLPADANKAVVSQLRALVVERKTLDQVSTQISADMRKYWDNVKYGTIDSDREAMLTNMVRLASNEIDKVSKMQADIEEVEARIRSDIEARPSATVGDFKGSKTVQYPAGGSYVINYRNIAEKVLSEGTDNVVRTGVYKTLDKVKDEATAAKRITAMAVKAIDKKKVKDEQPTTSTLDTITTPVDSVAEVGVAEPVVDATPTFTKRTMSWVVSRLSEKPSARNEDMQKEAIDEMLKSPEEGIQELTNAIVELQQLAKEANEDGDKAEARELRNEIKYLEEAIEEIKAVISDISVPDSGIKAVNSGVKINEVQTNVVVVPGLTYSTPDTDKAINVLRKYGALKNKNYGNPFGTTAYGANAEVPNQGTDIEVTKKYINWLKGTYRQDVAPERRAWIIKQISDGVLDSKQLMYFRNSANNHAKALAELVNTKNTWLTNNTNVDEVQTQSDENIAEMDKMAEEAKSLAEPKKVHESLRGVIIMGNSGIGKSYAKKMYADIVDGDDLFVQAANTILAKYKQQEHTIDSVSQMRSVFTLWGQYGKDEGKKTEAIKRRDEVYAEYARLAKTAATAGKTVLSSSARPDILKNAKVAVIQTDPETIAKNRASSLRDNQEEFNLEEASNKIKSFQEKVKDLQQIELSPGMYISDVLENGLSTFIKSEGPQVKKESRARKIKSAAEIRISEGEDEAAARVKAMFKTEDEVKAYVQTQSAEDGVVDIPVDGSVAVTSATDEGKPSRGKEVLDGAPLFNQNIGGVKVQSNLAAETFQDSGRGIDTSLLSEITAAVFNGKVQSVHREIHKVLQQLVKYDEFSHVKTQSNPFLMFVHKDKNYGQLFVDRKIAEAFTVGLTAYIADKFGTLRNNDNTQIQKLLGTTALIPASVRAKLSKQGRLLDNEADAIGRMIVSAMGVKSKDDVDYDMQERLASSVGTVALMVFQELGMVEIDNSMDASQLSHMRSIAEKLDVDGVPATIANMPKYDPSKAVSFVKMTLKYSGGGKLARWLPVATRNKELITTLQNEMEVERFTKEPRLDTEAKSKVFKTRNAETWTNITEEQMTTLNKAQNTPFKVNMEAVGDLIDMWGENTGELTVQQIKVAQLFGYDTVEDKHIDRRGGVTAKNNDIVESIQALVDFSKVANGRKVYFDYFFSKNGRFFMDSNTVNPQTDKLHRFLVTVDGGNTTIDDSSRDVYKIAIVQAFDQEKDLSSMDEDGTELRDIGAIDKQRQEDTIAQFDNIVNNVKIQEAVEAIRNSAENRVDKVLAAISNSKHPGHALAALRALVNYNESENFEADITMETDGTTSGFLLGLMTNPVMPFHKLVEWLAKGGVWVGSKTAETYGEWKSIAGNKDGYETSASAVDVAVKRHSITRPGILDFVGGVNRSFMKNPLMIFVYGAGIRRIRREIGQQAADKMIDSLSAGKSFDSMKLIIEDEIGVLRENRTEEGLKKQDILNIDKKIRELVSLRKELDGSVERLASKIREESVDANGMVTKLHKVVSSAAEKTYGAEVGNYLEDTFSELVSMRKAMNDVFDVSYKVFIDEFNRRSKEALTPGKTKLSKKQLEMLLADMVDEGKVPGILTVEATHRDEKAPIMKERKQPGLGDESRVQIGYAKDGKISTRTVHPMIYKMLANSAAGSVINIHYLDGAIIGKIIADGQGFGIHDAFVAHVNDVIGNVKKYNENVWTMTQEYDMLQRTLDELRRVHAANPELVEEHYTITNNGEVIPMFDDKIAELESMVNTINENKRLLSSMRIVSAQMAGPIGSTFDKPGLEDVVAKADNVGNVVAMVGLVRDTEGMSKENSDIVTASIKTDCKVNK